MIRVSLLFFLIINSITSYAEDTWVSVQPSFREVSFIGFSRARHDMVLSTEVAGKVKRVYVDVGDTIPRSGRVSCLDNTFTKLDINSTTNDIKQAQIDITYYKKQVKRYQDLVKKKSVSVIQLDDMQRELSTAENMEQSKKILIQRQQETLERHCIKAPWGWSVDERYVEEGQWIDIGNQVVKVGNYTTLLVPFALSVDELNALKKNKKKLSVWLPDYKQKIPAKIERISPAFDETSRKIKVDLLLNKKLPVRRGGLRVELKLKIPDSSGVFLIPSKTLDKRFEEVWVERKKGGSLRVELLGNISNELVRINSAELKTGDQLKILR
ncbi:MAG: efflux RND transporter periplasmic adaptor subunit [Methylococcaceae bacterium]